ncbi:lytic transglycosylase domain-containing protein [Sulfitobacter sp. D35]|uniref:lytic transglycosylase domain-containing protein n=1 Tax=Sulfitobacter sp. D35 TaxID=3083252 RepID=UPI00296F3A46|nr:lytic transglycosylase domain-containing protein [Sulfitobacter sp. D35]MDW4500145.1 lytic transglycosylase domain-containing protein [Sulfitobacter sp. D35]
MTRQLLWTLLCVFLTALPASAQRPRPLGWAMEAMRSGNWDSAARIAARDGEVAADVIEWIRLRSGGGTAQDVMDFLDRRPDWPGESYLRSKASDAMASAPDAEIITFYEAQRPSTPDNLLTYAAALRRAGRSGDADAEIVLGWRTLPMASTTHKLFLTEFPDLLKPHHVARLDEMLWTGNPENATRMFDLVPDGHARLAKARIALQKRAPGVDTLIAAVPASLADDAGLQYDRFTWRIRAGRYDDAKALLHERSVSRDALGRPEKWSNRRRSMARDEMRDGDPVRAYELAARHFLTEGSDYADLEWLAGYIALTKLKEPKTALAHFRNHDAAVASPISKGRAGYWRGRALEALGDAAAADQAYAEGAQHQTSFYGLLAAERAGLPFDTKAATEEPSGSWTTARFADNPVFEAGLLLRASGETALAERFWTHLAESLDESDAAILAQIAIDAGDSHLALMIAKRVAQRGLVIPLAYFPVDAVARARLPMAPEMVLSIARRESEFDPRVQSSVGARGLMQIMPATGREVAQRLGRGRAHSTERLISDPAYNAELGATYLAMLARRFDGNVVMMSAGYNAGPGRPDRWMREFGDPRRGGIDVVDWIEHIPFRETQNYVMRVTESLPSYRARLGKEALPVPFSEELTGSTLRAFAPQGE